MDLPITLELADFLEGGDEVKQSVTALLKNELGDFVQSVTIGNTITVHTPGISIQRMDYSVREALKPLRGLVVDRVYIIDASVEEDVLWGIDYTFNGTEVSIEI